MMIAADYGRATLLCTVPIAAAFQALRIEHLYVIALAVGILNMLFTIAGRSMLPSLIGRDELVEANGKLEVGRSASQVAGPGMAGVLIRAFSAPVALILDAVTFIISAVAVQTIRTPEPEAESSLREGDFIKEAHQGLRLIARSGILLPIALAAACLSIFNAMFEAAWLL